MLRIVLEDGGMRCELLRGCLALPLLIHTPYVAELVVAAVATEVLVVVAAPGCSAVPFEHWEVDYLHRPQPLSCSEFSDKNLHSPRARLASSCISHAMPALKKYQKPSPTVTTTVRMNASMTFVASSILSAFRA